MALMTRRGESALVQEERLARAAAAGDSAAFVELYERYEQPVFNVAYRVTGSEADAADVVGAAFLGTMRKLPEAADGDFAFASELYAATHDACQLLTRGRQPARPRETELAQEDDGISEANQRLPERQREALALRELGQLSYDEVAAAMAIDSAAVAQLISRALINLRDEQLGTALASVAPPSADCGRALPLIATREEEQLVAASPDAAWLEDHMAGCRRCRLGVDAMRQALESYRAWAPIAAVPWLLGETMAKAAALAGADWSGEIAERAAARGPAGAQTGTPSAPSAAADRRNSRRRQLALTTGLAVLLLAAGVAAVVARDDPPASTQAGATVGAASRSHSAARKRTAEKRGKSAAKPKGATSKKAATAASPAAAPAPVQLPTSGGATSEPASSNPQPAATAVEPTAPVPHPSGKPKAPSTSAPPAQPESTVAPPAEPPPAPPVEQSPSEIAKQHEPPGKATGRQPR